LICNDKMTFKPVGGELYHGFQGTGFWKEMSCAGNDVEGLFAFQTLQGPLVQFNHAEIRASHDKKCRSPDMGQGVACEIRTAAARDYRANAIAEHACRNKRSRRCLSIKCRKRKTVAWS